MGPRPYYSLHHILFHFSCHFLAGTHTAFDDSCRNKHFGQTGISEFSRIEQALELKSVFQDTAKKRLSVKSSQGLWKAALLKLGNSFPDNCCENVGGGFFLMELSGNAGSCHNQHRDVFENGSPSILNGMFPFENDEVNSPGLTTTQFALSSSSAELDDPASDNCIEARNDQSNVKSHAQEIFGLSREQIEETHNQIFSTQMEELNASVFLTGEQTSSADFNENGAGCFKESCRNEDVPRGKYEGQGFDEQEINAECSSCNDKGFSNTRNSAGQERFGPCLKREMFVPGVCPVQEAALQSNVTSTGISYSGPFNKLARPHLRDATANYVLECVKFVVLLMESLLQLPRVLKDWASQTMVKPKAIPTLAEKRVDKNEADNFVSEGASITEPQNGRGNVYTEDLVGALGFPLGMSIATVLAEILASNYSLKQNISAEEISELLGMAIRESLNKVLGCQCGRLIRDFEAAFTSTFKTITRIKQARYEKKKTSYPSEKKTSISDGQMPGLASVGYVNDTRIEYADALENPGGKFREKTDCKWLIEQTSGSLGSVLESGMKGEVQQFCKPIFTKSDLQITSNSNDELPKENCRVDCRECSCITESVNVKDRNYSTCRTNQHDGNVSLSHWEMGFANNEIEEISRKLKNIKFESADCKDFSMGNSTSVATETMAPTDKNIEENDSDLVSAISLSGTPSSMPGDNLHQQVVLPGQFQRQLANTASSNSPYPDWANFISNVDCRECSCITESVNAKDHNNSTCRTNQHAGNVSLSQWEMGFANNEIEEISKKLKNIKFESADWKDIAMGNSPSVATERMAPTDRNIEENDSDLVSAIYESSTPSSMSGANLNQQVVLHGQFQRQLANAANSNLSHPERTNSISNVFKKSLMEQERCNNLREVEIGLTMRRLRLKEAKMYVDTEANKLTRQSISMSQSKASFKESKFIDKKLNNAYVDLNRTCADHLVAGLMLMLFALGYGSWKYSYANLSHAIEMCGTIYKEPRKSSWFYNPMDSVSGHIQTFGCAFIVICRMLFGLAVIGILAILLLRRTVSSSSQTMPTSIILIVLGLVCGYAGKLSVDSLGGSGFHWLVQWEVLCLLHAFSACFPASLLRVLNGPPSAHEVKEKLYLIPLSLRKFIFHFLLLVLPVMAGLTPFASAREWTNHFSHIIFDNVLEPARTSVRKSLEQFLV